MVAIPQLQSSRCAYKCPSRPVEAVLDSLQCGSFGSRSAGYFSRLGRLTGARVVVCAEQLLAACALGPCEKGAFSSLSGTALALYHLWSPPKVGRQLADTLGIHKVSHPLKLSMEPAEGKTVLCAVCFEEPP